MKDQIPSTRNTRTRKDESPSVAEKKDYSSDAEFFDEEMDEVIDRLNELQWMLHAKNIPAGIKACLGEAVGFVIDLKFGFIDFFHELNDNNESEKSEEEE